MNIQLEVRELEEICGQYVMADSETYHIIRNKGEEEYLQHLRSFIIGMIYKNQSFVSALLTNEDYQTYINKCMQCVLGKVNKYDLKDRKAIFNDIVDGCLIGGFL